MAATQMMRSVQLSPWASQAPPPFYDPSYCSIALPPPQPPVTQSARW